MMKCIYSQGLKYLGFFLFLICAITVFSLNRLTEFDLPGEGLSRTLHFEHQQDRLTGTLILPAHVISPPVVLLVHGDGAQDRWSDGGYLPLVNYLVSQGIAVYSWDKPGTGESRGNWLAQTMPDRAGEAALALEKVRQQPELKSSRVGFLGFSQAGWVVPQASQRANADFVVLVGAAINWRAQGFYYGAQRRQSEGFSSAEIQAATERDAADFDRAFTPEIVRQSCLSSCTRQDFERRNAHADALSDIAAMKTPVMILMGEDDRNVNPHETVSAWAETLPAGTPRCIRLIGGATHGLLRSAWFDYQLASRWPLWKQGLFMLSGQYAWAPGALSDIAGWVQGQRCADAHP